MRFPWRFSVACLMTLSCGEALAVDFGGAELHGYGSQNYLQSSANTYLGADKHGSFDSNLIALVAAISLNDKSKFWAQLENVSGEQTRFDWFFVDYAFNDRTRIQVGRVKLPFGIYNETVDAHYLQLSALTPVVYQSAADFTHDAYQGIGLDYEHPLAGAGSVRAQIWGGNTVAEGEETVVRDRRAFGGKFTWNTPVSGLALAASAFRTRVQMLADNSFGHETRAVVSLDYAANNLDFKAEYASHELLDVRGKAWYAQAGYTFADRWTPYLRYDYVTTHQDMKSNPAYYQNIRVAGLGFRINNFFNLRVEDHINRGFALPVASEEVLPAEGHRNWNLLVVGVNFIF